MIRLLSALLESEDGATLLEYALVVSLIAVVAFIALQKLGTGTATNLNKAATSL